MNIKDLNKYLQSLPDGLMDDIAEIVAETATEEFKQSFKRKAFDGNPWIPAANVRRSGSLLIDSGALLNSIRPSLISPSRIVISAGNDKVTYAATHNEGFHGVVQIKEHIRNTKKGEQSVKAHSRNTNIPQRQFMGNSQEINDKIHNTIEAYINSKIDNL